MEMVVILLIAVLLFGANKIPKLARSTGQAMGEFRRGREEVEQELEEMKGGEAESDSEAITSVSTNTPTTEGSSSDSDASSSDSDASSSDSDASPNDADDQSS
jgi:sec-independent protein translocase protein TatA